MPRILVRKNDGCASKLKFTTKGTKMCCIKKKTKAFLTFRQKISKSFFSENVAAELLFKNQNILDNLFLRETVLT